MARTLNAETRAERARQQAEERKARRDEQKRMKEEEKKLREKQRAEEAMEPTDVQLFEALKHLGCNPGPVTDCTRAIYQRKLGKKMKEFGYTSISSVLNTRKESEKEPEKGTNAARLTRNNSRSPSRSPARRKRATRKDSSKKTVKDTVPSSTVDSIQKVPSTIDSHVKDEGRRTTRKKSTIVSKSVPVRRTIFIESDIEEEEEDEMGSTLMERSAAAVDDDSVQIINQRSPFESEEEEKEEEKNRTVDERGSRSSDREESKGESSQEEDEESTLSGGTFAVVEQGDDGREREEDEDGKEVEWDEGEGCITTHESSLMSMETSEEEGEEREEERPARRAARPSPIALHNCASPTTHYAAERYAMRRVPTVEDRRTTIDIFKKPSLPVSPPVASRPPSRTTMDFFGAKNRREVPDLSPILAAPNQKCPVPILQILEKSDAMDISQGEEKVTPDEKKSSSVLPPVLLFEDTPRTSRSTEERGRLRQREQRHDTRRSALRDSARGGDRSLEEEGQGGWEDDSQRRPMRPSTFGRTYVVGREEEESPPVHEEANERVERRSGGKGDATFDVKQRDAYTAEDATFLVNSTKREGGARAEAAEAAKAAPHAGSFVYVNTRRSERRAAARFTRNISRSPSRSPARNGGRTFIVTPRHKTPTKKMIPALSPARLPPKPLPRRIVPGPSASTAPLAAPPVPAPRTRLPPPRPTLVSKIGKALTLGSSSMGREDEERSEGEMSPGSLFNDQPRVATNYKEELKRRATPADREVISRLEMIRVQIKKDKQTGGLIAQKNVRDLDYEARLLVDDNRHLAPFFY